MILPDMAMKLRRSLIKHEGYKSHPYLDTANPPRITIGIGYNLSDRGLPAEWINNQYQQDVNYFYNKLAEFDWFHSLNEDRQIVLIDMSFFGWQKFLEFKGMIAALEQRDYTLAAEEMLNSEWAKEVKGRAVDLANAMKSGVYNV